MTETERQSIRGRVRLIMREVESGDIVEERTVANTIMTGGSELVAKRFCGEMIDPIAAVGVGENDTDPDDARLTDLKEPVKDTDDVPERAEIHHLGSAASYVTADEATQSATVKFGATFDAAKGNGELKEAGIFNSMTEGVLYNRVTFPVINKADTHELTLIWEITFSG